MTIEDIYFELSQSGNSVKLEPLGRIDYNSDLDWDKNWLKTKVTLKGGAFLGQFTADLMTTEFERFKQDLLRLYDNLNGGCLFSDIDGYLTIKVLGDGNGHFLAQVTACDEPGIGAKLTFDINFDQTQLKPLANQLDRVTKFFPIIGDFKIKNT